MHVRQVVPFLLVRDLPATSLPFYRDALGFTLTNEWVVDGQVRWCWLELGGAALMLQEFSREHLPQERLGVGVSLYFICDDAIAVYETLKRRGVDAKRPFVGNAMWVTGLRDPDGYELFFESPTDAAEESEYSA